MPEDCVAQMPLSLALRPGKSAKASDKLYLCFLMSSASPLLVGALQGSRSFQGLFTHPWAESSSTVM